MTTKVRFGSINEDMFEYVRKEKVLKIIAWLADTPSIKAKAIEELNAIPFIEQETTMEEKVRVVRCKECKFAHMTYNGECKYCDMFNIGDKLYLDGDFFCAFAEKKEES